MTAGCSGLFPFTLPHPYQGAGFVDVAGFQFQQFADAQSCGIEYGEHAEEAQVCHRRVEYLLYFLLAQHVGQRLLPFGTVHLVTPPFLTENFLVIELDGVDTLVLLAGGYVFLVDEIQQVVVYLAGGNRFNLTPLEMLLEIAEIGGIYPYGMVTVTHLLKFSR